MTIIELPRLVGTREAAKDLVDANVAADATEVTIYARAVLSAAPSFVDELVADLEKRGVGVLNVVGASQKLTDALERSSQAHNGALEIRVGKA